MRRSIFLSLIALGTVGLTALASADPTITPPSGFDEGTETKLTADQVAAILPWATNSQTQLKDLLEMIKTMPAKEMKVSLIRGIQEVVLASAPKSTELLMRYVLNRALKVEEIIEERTGPNDIGALDVENRVLRLSVQMATGYYQGDIDYLKSVQSGNAPLLVPYARFGYQYAEYLMSIDQSIFNAKAQYEVAVMALGLLQWDLARDAKLKTLCASSIHKIYSFLQIMPEKAGDDDGLSVAQLRQIRSLFRNVMGELKTGLSGVPTDGEVQLPADPMPLQPAPVPPPADNPGPDSDHRGACKILYSLQDDNQSRHCNATEFGVTYNGYLVSDSCWYSIDDAMSAMNSISACMQSDHRGPCSILYPLQDDNQSRHCDALKFGVVYNGYFTTDACYHSIDEAILAMNSDPACK